MSAVSILGLVWAVRAVSTQARPARSSVVNRLAISSHPFSTVAVDTRATVMNETRLEPLRAVRETFERHREEAGRTLETSAMASADADRLSIAVALDRTPFASTTVSEAVVDAFAAATTETEVQDAGRALVQTMEREHATRFADEIAGACRRAARSLGFRTRDAAGKPGRMRLVATDVRGRSLVTEVSTDAGGDVAVATEVVGVTDGTCHELLDRFDAELARLGVEAGPRERRTTGGVCTLAAAREFFGKVLKKSSPTAAETPAAAGQRTTRLNVASRAANRRGR